ncbi:beta-ketoacyl synthase N-terminal-like domain-containing protein [Aquabacterium sp.]|uniref:beta-ketoacyl synthase N-terminal-like domain-containing protein n=1 Tax=Aquabacterium sp. TaxID=1872578 RepID=UPI0037835EAD
MSSQNNSDGIAIIGMACLFPQAENLRAFWRNIVQGVDAISEPTEAWDAPRYLSSGRIKTAHGGYLKDLYRFDPRAFGIMPSSLDGGEPDQFLALKIASDALADAGYAGPDVDHRDTGIVLGHSTYLHRGQGTLIQNHIVLDQTIELMRIACPHLDEEQLGQVRALLEKRVPRSTADIAPGLVPNVMTGRIANRLNLRGPNYLVDAACSSSLLAVASAIDELRTGRSKLMLAGGVNASLPAEVSVIFTQLGALSGRGKVRPFETGSDGTLLGEGLGVVALKRLDDALADGDQVYGVLRGVGQASDGRGHGLLAPSVDGETLAIRRAYQDSGIDPQTVGLIECHGTGIPLGDKTEIAAIKNVLGERQADQGTVAIGSVKSMISHCIPAAGIAGLIKATLALHHRALPPTLCEAPNPELGIAQTPLYINTQLAPWIHRSDAPRRAGINSFGFGGINTHGIVEQAPAAAKRPDRFMPWPAELCVLADASAAGLVQRLRELAERCEVCGWGVAEVAKALAQQPLDGAHRIAIVAKDPAALVKALRQAADKLAKDDAPQWATRTGITYSRVRQVGQLAFLFPGEGSQFLHMFADLALCFDEVREWLDFWRGLYPDAPGHTRTDIVYPPAVELSPERRAILEARLHQMDVGSEAVFVGGQAMYALLKACGVEPDAMLGHSSGESSALAASGAIPAADREKLAEFIRELNVVYQQVLAAGKIPTGALLAVGALPAATVLEKVAATSGEGQVVVAMDNCANQLVLYGSGEAIDAMRDALAAEGGICLPLPFDRGYHTPHFQAVSDAFLKYYKSIKLGKPSVPLYSCASAGLFPDTASGIRQLAAAQWSDTVRFRETILRMHDDGVRCFVEVGPSNNLSAFVGDILNEREHLALATNQRRRNGVEQFLATLGQLFVIGRPLNLGRLFQDRALDAIDLAGAATKPQPGFLLDNTMPRVRLNDADRAALRALTAPPAALPASVENERPALPATPMAEPAPAPAAETVADGREQLVAEYFDLMRGFLDQQRAVLGRWQGDDEAAALPEAEARAWPLLDGLLEADESHLVAACRVDVETQAYLRDHVLSGAVSGFDPELRGLACVPMMVSLEIMAEACACLMDPLGTPGTVRLIEQVKAFDWIALDEGFADLQVRAERIAGTHQCKALLSRDGKPIMSASFGFEADWRLAPVAPPATLNPTPWNDEALYQIGMFHGPIFQSIAHIEGWDPGAISAQLSRCSLDGFLQPGARPALVLNPVMLDAVGQLAAFWIAQYAGYDFNCFPSTIERIELHAECPADQPGLRLVARQAPLDPAATEVGAVRRWDFEVLDGQGQPLLRVANLVNVFFAVPNRFYQVRRSPLEGALGEPLASPPSELLLWQLPHLPEEFCAQSGGIFLRMLAHATLGAPERAEWAALQGSVAWRRQWLLGRLCLKEAVREWVQRQTGERLHTADIWVGHLEQGGPFIDGPWCADFTPPVVSLSHNATGCLAAVAAPGWRIGVDHEQAGRVQRPELLRDALTEGEQQQLQGLQDAVLGQRMLKIWCAKEAAAKLTGLGLQGQPAAFDVRLVGEGDNKAMVAYEGDSIEVLLMTGQGAIVALAAMAVQDIGVAA